MEIINEPDHKNGKVIALISYLTFIGWIISYFLHTSNKTSVGIFHIRQSLLLHIISLCIGAAYKLLFIIPFGDALLRTLLHLAEAGLLIFGIVGIVYAVRGEEKKLPFIGDVSQRLFHNLD